MTRRRILTGLFALLCAVMAYAWIDGGRETMHKITQPVPLPENFR